MKSAKADKAAEDAALGLGTVARVSLPINGLMAEALESVMKLERRGPVPSPRFRNAWLRIVFEEALLACGEYAERYGSVPWQPPFEINEARRARRPELIQERQAIEKLLAKVSQE